MLPCERGTAVCGLAEAATGRVQVWGCCRHMEVPVACSAGLCAWQLWGGLMASASCAWQLWPSKAGGWKAACAAQQSTFQGP